MTRWMYACLVAGLALSPMEASAQDSILTIRETDATFEDVVADLQDAIINRGYVVDYHGRIGEMLARTADDVGAAKMLYRNAEFMHFCSATASRKAMEADLENIGFCPYVLFVYEAETTPGTVRVGFRRLPAGEGRNEVNVLLEEIMDEAAGD